MKTKDYAIIFLIGVIILLAIKGCEDVETIEVEVPVNIEVPVPVVEHKFDTIYLPKEIKKEVKVVDTMYLDKYIRLKDSVDKLEFIKDAITIREYSEKFEDSIQNIYVFSEVTGRLNSQTVRYVTKERVIKLDTTINTTIDVPYKNKFAIGGEIGIPLKGVQGIYNGNIKVGEVAPSTLVKANLYLDTKKMLYNISIDTDSRVYLGGAYKF